MRGSSCWRLISAWEPWGKPSYGLYSSRHTCERRETCGAVYFGSPSKFLRDEGAWDVRESAARISILSHATRDSRERCER
eukprot:scaffold48914_cov58-Phaeocystis_antarctica.AAC.2